MAKITEDMVFSKISDALTLFSNTPNNQEEKNHFFLTERTTFFIRNNVMITLSGEDFARYSECLYLLLEKFDENIIDRSSVEELFQNSIVNVINSEPTTEKPISEKISTEVKELKKSLRKAQKCFSVHFQVMYIKDEKLPYKFGKVEFCKFDETIAEKFTSSLLDYKGDENQIKIRKELSKEYSDDKILNHIVAIVDKFAIDYQAARRSAEKELTLTIDIINFFNSLYPYTNGLLYLPGEFQSIKKFTPIITKEEHPVVSTSHTLTGLDVPFSFQTLITYTEKNKINITRVSEMLSKNTNDIEKGLIAAMHWAGKAVNNPRNEEAFLLYAISLESLVLLDHDKEELNDRLSTRVAFLIGNNKDNCVEIKNFVKELYSIRSSIVHSGSYRVTQIDLNTIRAYTTHCILRVLSEEPFVSMKDKKEFTDWFIEKMFS